MKGILASVLAVALATAAALLVTQENAADRIVNCVNTKNGFAYLNDDAPWDLRQARLNPQNDLPPEVLDDEPKLEDGYHLIAGRMIGWHHTWSAYLYLGDTAPIAYDSRPDGYRLAYFGDSFVPDEVKEAFIACGVEWGGSWAGDAPFAFVQQLIFALPEPTYTLREGAGLLPP